MIVGKSSLDCSSRGFAARCRCSVCKSPFSLRFCCRREKFPHCSAVCGLLHRVAADEGLLLDKKVAKSEAVKGEHKVDESQIKLINHEKLLAVSFEAISKGG